MSSDATPEPTPNLPALIEKFEMVPLLDLAEDRTKRNVISTNFGNVGPRAAAFITQALANQALDLEGVGSNVFPTRYYLAHVTEYIDDDGEMIPMVRVVLIGPQMETLAFVSEGAIRSLDLIRSLCGDGPWNPPLPLSVVQVKTRRNRKTYRLVVGGTFDDPPKPTLHSSGDEPKGKRGRD